MHLLSGEVWCLLSRKSTYSEWHLLTANVSIGEMEKEVKTKQRATWETVETKGDA